MIMICSGFSAWRIPGAYAEDDTKSVKLVIIMNSKSPIKDISLKKLKRIYEGKIKSIKGLGNVLPIDLPKKDANREAFSKIVLNKEIEEVIRMYLKNALLGKSQSPKIVKTEQDVIKTVKNNLRAIAYVNSNCNCDGVMKITINTKKFLESKKRLE